MAVQLAPHVPRRLERRRRSPAKLALGDALLDVRSMGEIIADVARDEHRRRAAGAARHARLEYQQLMEIAGVDYPERAERFEVVYCLLSLTRNRRIRVNVSTDEQTPVPSVTGLWPVAGWLEREVFDMYGVAFSGNADLRRILTDYGFEGYPQRKDFPLTGHVELRYSEAEKRVVYEPVSLPQDFRTFDFLMPWEGPEYRLPGDEKATAEAPGAPSPAPAPAAPQRRMRKARPTPKTTDKPADTVRQACRRRRRSRRASRARRRLGSQQAQVDADPKPKGRAREDGGAA